MICRLTSYITLFLLYNSLSYIVVLNFPLGYIFLTSRVQDKAEFQGWLENKISHFVAEKSNVHHVFLFCIGTKLRAFKMLMKRRGPGVAKWFARSPDLTLVLYDILGDCSS